MQGHKVSAIISKQADIKKALLPLGINIIEVQNFASWDFFAKAYIKKIMRQLAPDAVIAHGNRAISLCKPSHKTLNCLALKHKLQISNLKFKLIGVTHNYSTRHLLGLDAVLATTNDLKEKIIAAGQPGHKVFKLPNMVRIGEIPSEYDQNQHTPPNRNAGKVIIGTMGRFVKKKGFDVFIRAMADLKSYSIDFQALIGGGGEEEQPLKDLATKLGLEEHIKFIGWVNNKPQFFDNIDIFCLPSLHEPFGIILLEAFASKKPVVAANSEGPSEIICNNEDALLVQKGNSKAMAEAILRIYNDAKLAQEISQNAFAKAGKYDIKHFASSLSDILSKIVKK
jgi:glycosyltransferase involved in cell wall biosynthesis